MIAGEVTVNLQADALETLIRELGAGSGMYVKVGVLGDYAGRTPDEVGTKRSAHKWTEETRKFFGQTGREPTNPEIGADHEFGSILKNLPERSFLRVPLITRLPDALNGVDFVSLVLSRGAAGALDVVGNVAMGIVLQAFDTGGFGQWPQWSPKYWRLRLRIGASSLRRPGRLLVLTGQLVRSITYAVVRRGSPESPIYSIG